MIENTTMKESKFAILHYTAFPTAWSNGNHAARVVRLEGETHEACCDYAFEQTNAPWANGLTTIADLSTGGGFYSLSVGDVIEFDNAAYLIAGSGFVRVTLDKFTEMLGQFHQQGTPFEWWRDQVAGR